MKTHVSQTWKATIKGFASSAMNKFTSMLPFRSDAKKETGNSKEKDDLPLNTYEMNVTCLKYYLSEHENLIIQGKFHPRFNMLERLNEINHICQSMQCFPVSVAGVTKLLQVPQLSDFKEVSS